MNLCDRIADLSEIWKQVSFIFPYFDKNKINWNEKYREYTEKVIEAKTEMEFHFLLAEFMNLLSDGHTDYLFPEELYEKTGFLPFSLKYIGGSYYIDSAVSGYEKYLSAKIIAVNGIPFSDLLEKTFRYIYHVKSYAPPYALNKILPFFMNYNNNVIETSKGSFSFDLAHSKPRLTEKVSFDSPREYSDISNGRINMRIYDSNILYIKLDDFLYEGAAEEIRTAIRGQKSLSGVILDLRENIGGMTMFGAKIAELFIPETFHACSKKTRTLTGLELASASQIGRWSRETIEKNINSGLATSQEVEKSLKILSNTFYDEYTDTFGSEDNSAIFSGTCILLTSHNTVSAAEDFVAMFRTSQRGTIIGTETCGTTGTPFLETLSCKGRIRICSVGYRLLDGTEFIGCGIKPNIYKEISPEDFENGFDSVLEYSIEKLL